MMNETPIGFGVAIEAIFISWLTVAIFEADYRCLTVHEVIDKGVYDLGLNVETIRRLIIKYSAPGAVFICLDGLVTFRDVSL